MYLHVCAGFNDYVPVTRGNKDSVSTLPTCRSICCFLANASCSRNLHGTGSGRVAQFPAEASVRGTGSTGIIITPSNAARVRWGQHADTGRRGKCQDRRWRLTVRARAQVIKMFDHCKRHLKHGNPLVFFPEGSRSTDGSIKQFKPGAFSLALETQVVLFLPPFVLAAAYAPFCLVVTAARICAASRRTCQQGCSVAHP